MPPNLTPENLLQIFTHLDRDGSGALSKEELTRGLVAAGIKEENVTKLMDDLDVNGDGQIPLHEYKLALGLSGEPIGEWKRLFLQLDRDRSGTIDKKELQTMFKQCGINANLQMMEDWINLHDTGGDGLLDYGEFMNFVVEEMAN